MDEVVCFILVIKIIFDYYVSEDDLGVIVFKDVKVLVMGLLVVKVVEVLGVEINLEIVNLLFVVIVIDMGWFCFFLVCEDIY